MPLLAASEGGLSLIQAPQRYTAEAMKNHTFLLAWIIIGLALADTQSVAQSTYEPYTFTTLAIQGNCVAVDGAGNIYVTINNTIRKITPAGMAITLAGAGSGSADGVGSAAQFNSPSSVAVDNAGNVYVADTGNNTIRKIYPSGLVTTLAGLAGSAGSADGTGSAARFSSPSGVAVDNAGNVYVADLANYSIRKIGSGGVVTTLAGLAGSWGHMDGTGSAAQFSEPRGVAVDGAGNVYVGDSFYHLIRKVTPSGVVTTFAGIAGNGGSADGTGSAAQFNSPSGVAVDNAGNVYVADKCSIRKVTPSGVVTTLAGLAPYGGSADGTGSAARFSDAKSVAVDSSRNVYVADSGVIRKGYPANVPAVIDTSIPGFGFNGGQFGFLLTGPTGQLVVVEASTNLVNWLPIWTNTFAGARYFSDPQSGTYSHRFYRARTP